MTSFLEVGAPFSYFGLWICPADSHPAGGSQFRIADLIFGPEITRFVNKHSVITDLQSLMLHLPAKRS
jgi:hypothetical protein